MESFFGADSPYIARRHHRDSTWADTYTRAPEQPDVQEQCTTTGIPAEVIESPPSPQFPAIDTETLLEAPTAALERLTQLTSEQVVNLRSASLQAGEILNDLKGSAEVGAGNVLSNLEDVHRQLAPEVQSQVEKIGTVLEKQVIEAQDVLMQAVKAMKQQAESLSQQASSSLSSSSKATAVAPDKKKATPPPLPKQQQSQSRSRSTTSNTPSDLESVRFKAEMQQLTGKLESLSRRQFKSLQEAVIILEQELTQRTEQLRSFISEKRVELSQTVSQLARKTPQQQQQASAQAGKVNKATTKRAHPPAKTKAAPVVPQQKSQAVSSSPSSSSSTISAPVQRLSKTAESVKNIWQDRVQSKINKINVPSISIPTPIANFDATKMKSAVANNPQTVAVGVGVLAVTALGLFLRKNSRGSGQAEQDVRQRARSRRRLQRQRKRFKQALGADEDGNSMIDSSVFAAVQRIQSSKAEVGADGDDGKDADGGLQIDDSEDDDDDEGALGSNPQLWDPAMMEQWNAFVKSSKLKDAALWDPNEVDEGLPEVYVDLDRD